MQVRKGVVVTLAYKVYDFEGSLVDPGDQPLVYLHGGEDNIFAKIEQALEGKSLGDSIEVALAPEDAFGDYDEDGIELVDLSEFPEDIEVGHQVEKLSADGLDSDLYTVTDIAEGKVVLDANHPLAGMTLVFDCTVSALRPATPEELAAGEV